jgi:hypothetical protein
MDMKPVLWRRRAGGRRLTLYALAAILGACTTLAGCNDIYSERPLFGEDDARGSPPLRTGLWLERDPQCRFDETRPWWKWPGCASWMVVRPGQMLARDAKPQTWTSIGYVLAGGEPRVLQVTDPEPDRSGAYYLGLEPQRLDEAGRIVEYRAWSAKCGPPPPPQPDGKARSLTLEPLPGLQPHPDEAHADDCRAQGEAAVRAAVKASPAWTSAETWRWVRDGER